MELVETGDGCYKRFPFLVENDRYYYDADAVARVVEFIETFCKLSDPRGAPFILLPWQRQVISDVFGWYRRDNAERRFSYVWIEVPRKNGKSYFVAAILLYLLIADGCSAAEVYAAATTSDQSGRVYKYICQMIEQSDWLRERLDRRDFVHEIRYAKGFGSVLKTLSGDGLGKHSFYPSAVYCDELHEWVTPSSEYLHEALTSGFGNRKSPLVIYTTTAGFGGAPTLAKKLHEKALKFATGKLEDETFYGVVYGADLKDDWTSEATQRKANPSYELVKKTLQRELQKAQSDPSEENSYKRLYLNIWTQQQTRWLSMELYDACVAPLSLDDFDGEECVIGIDLSQIYDLTAVSLIFRREGRWHVFVRSYVPAQQIEKRAKEDFADYRDWAERGWITATHGVSQGLTIDYETIAADVIGFAERFDVRKVGYDPASSVLVVPQLVARGLDCMPIYPSFNDMTFGAKEFARRIASREIVIEENPCLRWQAANAEVAHKGEMIMIAKPNSNRGGYGQQVKYKVDGITATVIAANALVLSSGAERQAKPERKVSVAFIKR